MARKRRPRLVELDMKLANEHNHPHIQLRKNYLILWDGKYYAGKFTRQWYGLNFSGVFDAGLQFDTPGTNASRWQQVWEIKDL